MSRRILKRPQAERDLVELFAYLHVRSEPASRAFLKESKKAFELILSVPGIGRRWESFVHQGLRVPSVSRRFHDYLIFYRAIDNENIEIVRVLHGMRDLPALIDSLPEAPSD